MIDVLRILVWASRKEFRRKNSLINHLIVFLEDCGDKSGEGG